MPSDINLELKFNAVVYNLNKFMDEQKKINEKIDRIEKALIILVDKQIDLRSDEV